RRARLIEPYEIDRRIAGAKPGNVTDQGIADDDHFGAIGQLQGERVEQSLEVLLANERYHDDRQLWGCLRHLGPGSRWFMNLRKSIPRRPSASRTSCMGATLLAVA